MLLFVVFTAEASPSGAAKIPVSTRDIFAVSYGDIAAALGLTQAETALKAENAELAMRCGDRAVAYLPDPANSRILFYGWPATNRYTRANMFWIEPGVGRHMERVAPEPAPAPPNPTFFCRRNEEKEVYVMVEFPELRDDIFYWDFLNAANVSGGGNRKDFAAPLDGYAGGPVAFTVRLFGWNDTAWNPDHRANLYFNGTLVGTRDFDGRAEVVVEFTVPESLVLPSGNKLAVEAYKFPYPDSNYNSYIMVDGFEMAFVRDYTPSPALLVASPPASGRLSADLFSAPLVLEVTDPYLPRRVADDSGIIPAGHTWPGGPDSVWAFRETAALPTATPRAAGGGAFLRQTTHRVDYLVIAPKLFEGPAAALAARRQSQGLRTLVAFYEDICDQFAAGLQTPDAIEAFLKYAQQHWAAPPWMAVLCGRSDYQYLYPGATGPERLPASLAATTGGLRPADGIFADTLGDDGVPDIAVGRIPARTIAELEAYLSKVIAYEEDGERPNHGVAVFVSDLYDPSAGDFKTTNLNIAAETARRYSIEHLHRDGLATGDMRSGALNAFSRGVGLIHYTGHGNSSLIADSAPPGRVYLQTSDFNSMTNAPVPVFFALTCLLGRFDDPTRVYFSEAATLRAVGGAMAVYAPSGLSWNYFAEQLGKEIHRIHATEGANTLGPLILRARRNLGGGVYSERFRVYNLIGDPALKLRGGAGGSPPFWARRFEQWRRERFSPAELASETVSGPEATAPGRAWTNFEEYAHGGETPGLRFGPESSAEHRCTVVWTERGNPEDIEYRLWVTDDLRRDWSPAPPETVFTREIQPDTGLVRAMAVLPFDGRRLFVKLEALPK